MLINIPRIVISALSGGSGKTMISVGLARALARRGYRVQTFKKGPDYIDTLWAALAGGLPPRNLDPYMNGDVSLPELFINACRNSGSNFYAAAGEAAVAAAPGAVAADAAVLATAAPNAAARAISREGEGRQAAALPDIAIIEGNRGLFDGMDLCGSCSTAELARQLAAPVLLTVNCTKMTRTAAALVKGCKDFEAGVNLAGVILNQASRERHREIVRRAVEELAGVPVFGAIPRLGREPFEERHNGLLGEEAILAGAEAFRRLDELAEIIENNVDIDALVALAKSAPALEEPAKGLPDRDFTGTCAPGGGLPGASGEFTGTQSGGAGGGNAAPSSKPRIGYVRDPAFWFYYTENLEALERAGAKLVPVSLLDAGGERPCLSELDGLYIGAGFPEDYAARLSAATSGKVSLKAAIEAGMPVYAEGSAIYYLARELKYEGRVYPMCGVFDLAVELGKRPRGIGYVEAVVEGENPFHPVGSRVRAHEFHYATLEMPPDLHAGALMRMAKGEGLLPGRVADAGDEAAGGRFAAPCGFASGAGNRAVEGQNGGEGRDGLLRNNCFAALMQIFAPGAPRWAGNFVSAAKAFAANRHE